MKNIFKGAVATSMLFAASFGAFHANAQGALQMTVDGSLAGNLPGGNYSGYVLTSVYNVYLQNFSPTLAAAPGVLQVELTLPNSLEFLPTYPGIPTGWTYTPGLTPQSVILTNTTATLGSASTPLNSFVEFAVPIKTIGATVGTPTYSRLVNATPQAQFIGWSVPQQSNVTYGAKTVTVGNNPLPVLFKDFTVTAEGCKAVLNWSTAVEKNNSHFEIERSQNGTEFRSIGSTNGAGTSFEVNSYTYVDEKPENLTNFYRIRQVDFDKKSTTSTIENAKFDCKVSGISVYPNPTSDVVYVKGLTDKGSIKVYNMVGQLVIDKKVENNLEGINMSSLAEGTYQIQVFSGDKSVFNTKLIKR